MRIKIDKEEIVALRKAVDETSQSEIARQTGVGQHSISEYISGKTLSWGDSTRAKLYSAYAKFLPEEYKIKQKNIKSNINQSLFGNVSGTVDSDLISRKQLIKKITEMEISAEIKLQLITVINDL